MYSTTCAGVLDIFDIFKEHALEKKVSRIAPSETLLADIDHVFKLERKQNNKKNDQKKDTTNVSQFNL